MKSKQITRRDFLFSALGVSGLAAASSLSASPALAFADDAAFEAKVAKYVPPIPLTSVESVNASNRAANEAWEKAVRQALSEGFEVYEIEPGTVPPVVPRAAYSPVCTKRVYSSDSLTYTVVGFTASYTVDSNNRINQNNVWGVQSFRYGGLGQGNVVDVGHSMLTFIDGGRTMTLYYTSRCEWNDLMDSVTTVTFAQFYYNGNCNCR